jgi:hypothetical protein
MQKVHPFRIKVRNFNKENSSPPANEIVINKLTSRDRRDKNNATKEIYFPVFSILK